MKFNIGKQSEKAKQNSTKGSDSELAPAQSSALEAEHHVSRRRVMRRMFLFQFKLLADGVRDLILSPLSILAVLLGLIAGNKEPDKYFNRLLRFGRRSDIWINLFDAHKGKHTSNAWIAPIEEKMKQKMSETVDEEHWVSRSSRKVHTALDYVNSEIEAKKRTSKDKSTES